MESLTSEVGPFRLERSQHAKDANRIQPHSSAHR